MTFDPTKCSTESTKWQAGETSPAARASSQDAPWSPDHLATLHEAAFRSTQAMGRWALAAHEAWPAILAQAAELTTLRARVEEAEGDLDAAIQFTGHTPRCCDLGGEFDTRCHCGFDRTLAVIARNRTARLAARLAASTPDRDSQNL